MLSPGEASARGNGRGTIRARVILGVTQFIWKITRLSKRAILTAKVNIVYNANMSRKTATLGVRLSEETSRIIKEISSGQGRTPSDLLAEYAEEMARESRFCHIEFRSTPLGRMAYVEGTRSAVWLIADLVRQEKGDIARVAKIHEWPESKVRAAVNYAKAYRDEIDPLIEEAHKVTLEDLQRLNAA